MALRLPQGLARIHRTDDRIELRQPSQYLAPGIAGRTFSRQQRTLPRPARRVQCLLELRAPDTRQLAARLRIAAARRQQSVQMHGQLRRREARHLPHYTALQAFQRNFRRQHPTQLNVQLRPHIALIHIRRPAGAAQQSAEIGQRHALRMHQHIQQTQANIHQRFSGQRCLGGEHIIAFQRRPARTDRIRMQGVIQRPRQRMPPRRQIGDGDAHTRLPVTRQKIPRPSRSGKALCCRIRAFTRAHPRHACVAEIHLIQRHATFFEHRQQARQPRVGRGKSGNAHLRRQAAQAARDALDTPAHRLIRRAPIARLASLRHALAPVQKRAVFLGLQGIRHLDAPGLSKAFRLGRRQRQPIAVK